MKRLYEGVVLGLHAVAIVLSVVVGELVERRKGRRSRG